MPEKLESTDTSVTMLDLANQTGREALVQYIKHTEDLYKSMGVTVDTFRYYPDTKTVKIEYTPGRAQEGHVGIVHGGILSFMIDASAGALSMAVGGVDDIALTKGTTTKFVQSAKSETPISIISSTRDIDSKKMIVQTEVVQNGVVLTQSDSEFKIVNKKVFERINRGGK